MTTRVGELLRARRGDVSLRNLAAHLGVSHVYLSKVERGVTLVSPASAQKMARKLATDELIWVESAINDQLEAAKIKHRASLTRNT